MDHICWISRLGSSWYFVICSFPVACVNFHYGIWITFTQGSAVWVCLIWEIVYVVCEIFWCVFEGYFGVLLCERYFGVRYLREIFWCVLFERYFSVCYVRDILVAVFWHRFWTQHYWTFWTQVGRGHQNVYPLWEICLERTVPLMRNLSWKNWKCKETLLKGYLNPERKGKVSVKVILREC